MIALHVMQVPIMQVIDMPIVFDYRVAAAGLVPMVMVRMLVAGTHSERLQLPYLGRHGRGRSLMLLVVRLTQERQ